MLTEGCWANGDGRTDGAMIRVLLLSTEDRNVHAPLIRRNDDEGVSGLREKGQIPRCAADRARQTTESTGRVFKY
jgi:hypothetical protein